MVPFRNCKITRLFQDALLGHGRVAMIVNTNPCVSEFEETCHALRYAAIASEIVVSRRVDTGRGKTRSSTGTPDNSAMAAERALLIEDLWQEIDELKQEVIAMHGQCAMIEEEVRDEVASEMAERLGKMESMYQHRIEEEVAQTTNMYERKISMLTEQGTKEEDSGTESDGEDIEALQAGMEALQVAQSEQIEALRAELLVCKQEQSDLITQLESGSKQEAKKVGDASDSQEFAAEKEALVQQVEMQVSKKYEQIIKKNTKEADAKIKKLEAAVLAEQENGKTLQEEKEALERRLEEMLCMQQLTGADGKLETAQAVTAKDTLVVRNAKEQEQAASRVKISRKASVVQTPEKSDFINGSNELKVRHCEVLNSSGLHGGSPITTLYKGDVRNSVSGEGVSVTFTDVEQLERQNITTFMQPDEITAESEKAKEPDKPKPKATRGRSSKMDKTDEGDKEKSKKPVKKKVSRSRKQKDSTESESKENDITSDESIGSKATESAETTKTVQRGRRFAQQASMAQNRGGAKLSGAVLSPSVQKAMEAVSSGASSCRTNKATQDEPTAVEDKPKDAPRRSTRQRT